MAAESARWSATCERKKRKAVTARRLGSSGPPKEGVLPVGRPQVSVRERRSRKRSSGERRLEVGAGRPTFGNEFEGRAQGGLRAEAVYQQLGELPPRHHAVAGVAGLRRVALQQHQAGLVGSVVVKPTRAHDGVRHPAGAHHTFATACPVVGLGRSVVAAAAVGDTDGRHQRDAHAAPMQREQDVAHAPHGRRARLRRQPGCRCCRWRPPPARAVVRCPWPQAPCPAVAEGPRSPKRQAAVTPPSIRKSLPVMKAPSGPISSAAT